MIYTVLGGRLDPTHCFRVCVLPVGIQLWVLWQTWPKQLVIAVLVARWEVCRQL